MTYKDEKANMDSKLLKSMISVLSSEEVENLKKSLMEDKEMYLYFVELKSEMEEETELATKAAEANTAGHTKENLNENTTKHTAGNEVKNTAPNAAANTEKALNLTVAQINKDLQDFSFERTRSFDALVEEYVNKHIENKKAKGIKVTRTDLYWKICKDKNKWDRMLIQKGRRHQYTDDVRRFCIALELSFGQATEFLWSTGHPLDLSDKRDYAIAQCLCRHVYDEEKVDQCLRDNGLEALFTV